MSQLIDVPAGLNGVVAAETAIGAVDGDRGFFHYGAHDATDLARTRSFEDVWFLMRSGRLPSTDEAATFRREIGELRSIPPALQPVIEADPSLGHAAAYLYQTTGEVPTPVAARAVEQYMILTIDHGFNASTFAARVVASTGADPADALCAALGALAGPLHGGAPSRALDALDVIATPAAAAEWVRREVASGRRIMGFGHAVYRARPTPVRHCCERWPNGSAVRWSSTRLPSKRRSWLPSPNSSPAVRCRATSSSTPGW